MDFADHRTETQDRRARGTLPSWPELLVDALSGHRTALAVSVCRATLAEQEYVTLPVADVALVVQHLGEAAQLIDTNLLYRGVTR